MYICTLLRSVNSGGSKGGNKLRFTFYSMSLTHLSYFALPLNHHIKIPMHLKRGLVYFLMNNERRS